MIDECVNTELTIKAREYLWDDIDINEELGKEAAKTIVALDYYLKS